MKGKRIVALSLVSLVPQSSCRTQSCIRRTGCEHVVEMSGKSPEQLLSSSQKVIIVVLVDPPGKVNITPVKYNKVI